MRAVAQLPPGAVPAFLGLILILAVLIEPYVIRQKLPQRLWARLRGLPPPLIADAGGVAIQGAQTFGARATARAMDAKGLARFFYRRDSAAIILAVLLWLVGLLLRPDFWGSLDNSFNLLLAFTEVALLSIGLTFVIANGDIDLSVGSVLALSGATAAFCMKDLGFEPGPGGAHGTAGRAFSPACSTACWSPRFRLPAFVATLGMFYMARGVARLAGRRARSSRAFRRELQPDRPQADRAAALLEHRAGDREPPLRHRRGGERPDHHHGHRGDRRRHRARLHDRRAEGLATGGNTPRRRLCRHQHQPRALLVAGVLRLLRGDRGRASTSPSSRPSTRPPGSSASSTPSPR